MNPDPYNDRVRALFAAPAHVGSPPEATRVSANEQGVRIELSAITAKGAIERLSFRAWGCPHVIAAAEWLCTQYEGRAVAELDTFATADLMQSLAVPLEKSGRILVIEDAVRSLGAAIREASSSAGQH